MNLKPYVPLIVLLSFLTPLPTLAEFAGRQTPAQQQTSLPAQSSPAPSPSPAPKATPSAQPSPSDEDVVRITTNLVQVDAVITDKSGKLITDLRPEELRISEDGREQKITNLSYVVTASEPQPTTTKPTVVDKLAPIALSSRLRPEQVKRTIALVVDDLGLSFESMYFVRKALKKFVDEQIQPGDLVAIVRTSGGIGALQEFTSDKRQLYAAVERVRFYPMGRSGTQPYAAIQNSAVEPGETRPNQPEELRDSREVYFTNASLMTISHVVHGLRELPGRKSILLVSDGLRLFNYQVPSQIVSSMSSGTGNADVVEALRRLIDQATRASVVIYSMNATGLQPLGLTAADNTNNKSPALVRQLVSDRRTLAFENQDGLSYLAEQTGGIAIHDTNDLGGGIKRVLDDQKGYYLIGYRPEDSTFDAKGRRTFHKLSLKVLRPGKYNVRTHTGFFGFSDEDRTAGPLSTTNQLLGALFSPFGSSGVRVRLTSFFANDVKDGSIARSMLHISAGDLVFVDQPGGWHQAVFDVVAATFGDNGGVVDHIARTHTFRVKDEAYERVVRDGFDYLLTFPIKNPGAYQLRTAVRDHGSQRIGSAAQFIEIPDLKKNRLILSSLVVSGQAALNNETAGNGAASVAAHADDADETDPTYSAAVRQFHVGAIINYGVAVYNARLNKDGSPPQVQTQVRLFRDGKPVFVGKETPLNLSGATDFNRLGASGAVQVGSNMEPGEYVLQVIVTDLLADPQRRVAAQSIDFEVLN